MGNICRSPTAEGVFKAKLHKSKLLDSIHVDSAGTHNYHPNSPPDSRSQMHALKRGYDLSNLRARAVSDNDFESFENAVKPAGSQTNYIAATGLCRKSL